MNSTPARTTRHPRVPLPHLLVLAVFPRDLVIRPPSALCSFFSSRPPLLVSPATGNSPVRIMTSTFLGLTHPFSSSPLPAIRRIMPHDCRAPTAIAAAAAAASVRPPVRSPAVLCSPVRPPRSPLHLSTFERQPWHRTCTRRRRAASSTAARPQASCCTPNHTKGKKHVLNNNA